MSRLNADTDRAEEYVEWESTIHIPIEENQFEKALSSLADDERVDVIFLYTNDTRLSQRQVQCKRVLTTKHVLGFLDGRYYPIVRTTSTEKLSILNNDARVCQATTRIIRMIDGVRMTINCVECDYGVRYYMEFEIEYACDSNHELVHDAEERLMRVAADRMRDTSIRFAVMSLENIFSCIMQKVQMWHCFDPKENYVWAYKWNGIKAKLILPSDRPKTAYLWPDASDIEVVSVDDAGGIVDYSCLLDLCVLVELIDDETMALIEVIGVKYGSNIHNTEVSTNVRIIKYLREKFADLKLRVGGRLLLVQTFMEAPKPDDSDDVFDANDRDLYDGYIIVQKEMIIKWKCPTLDVLCTTNNRFVAGDNRAYDLKSFIGTENSVYEIDGVGRVLRKRNDRLAPSTEQECRAFERSTRLLSRRE